jgi:hypothetical protein
MTRPSSCLILPARGRVAAFAAAVALCLTLQASAKAEERVTRDLKKINVRGEEIYIVKNHQPYFWRDCYPEIVDSFRGPRTIEVGETISFSGSVVRVGLIRYIEHPEWTGAEGNKFFRYGDDCAFDTVYKSKGFNEGIRQHTTDCLVMSDESVLPPDGKCDTTWILVAECKEYIEEPTEELAAENQTGQAVPAAQPVPQQ